ncbi:Aminoacyl tRNA synthase complex-interacting multifunctional protein 1 [Quaeritorhiza haematococci]|nr:Aminoacyl tRNA synthase complex-interacting multifunctional protein 1 [Quaeritorhiza haematococci]
MRVGRIVAVQRHPQADSLYVSEIDVGEEKPRQVVSGLVRYLTEDQMKDRLVVVVCNLKPAKLRGVKSEAMVLAAFQPDETKVELVDPPRESRPGDRVWFEGYEGMYLL